MLYIPTITKQVQNKINKDYDYVLYSPSTRTKIKYKARKITIWDNHTFYYLKRYYKEDKQEKAYQHYIWLIEYIRNNYEEGITLITPDIEWLDKAKEVMKQWYKHCSKYPQICIPKTCNENKLNIIGYALRPNSPNYIHPKWVHCLMHKRDLNTKLLTYDATFPID